MIEQHFQLRETLTSMMFDILKFLHEEALEGRQPQAQGVENSIWQSMRVDMLPSCSHGTLPDEVGRELFEHPDVVQRASETILFDKSHGLNGDYHQVWLLDRIMSTGGVWAGRYKREFSPRRGASSDDDADKKRRKSIVRVPESLFETGTDDAGSPSITEACDVEHESDPREDQNAETGPSVSENLEKPRTASNVLGRQWRNMFLDGVVAASQQSSTTSAEGPVSNRYETEVPSGKLLTFMLSFGGKVEPFERDEQLEKKLVSVFDVDGPCLIATPYSSEWEVLPHPEYRSMSVCWVIEPYRDSEGDDGAGMNDLEELGDDGVGPETGTKRKWKGKSVDDGKSDDTETNGFNRGQYRVMNKVKGMWEIMELPWQRYKFV
ncbi:hypothetical protein SGCOL_003093 [Colletotrichum sp. CLE4]